MVGVEGVREGAWGVMGGTGRVSRDQILSSQGSGIKRSSI